MAKRRARKPAPEAVKAAADRAEGMPADDPTQDGVLGRPTVFKTEFVGQAQKLYQLGATELEVADFFGVNRLTIHRWAIKYPDFCNARKIGKAAADDRVEHTLYQKAVGYTFESEKIFQFQGEIVRAKTLEHVPPSDVAMIFWLKNRKPQQWRDVHKHEHGSPGDFDKMSADELRKSIAGDLADLGEKDAAAAFAGGARVTIQ